MALKKIEADLKEQIQLIEASKQNTTAAAANVAVGNTPDAAINPIEVTYNNPMIDAAAKAGVDSVGYYNPAQFRSLSPEKKRLIKSLREVARQSANSNAPPAKPSKQLQEQTSELKLDDEEEHPLLGKPIANLGYKRIYLTPHSTLGTIPIWNKQRHYQHPRAHNMASEKLKTLHLGFPGIICLHEEEGSGKLRILDGQHRVGMMQVLKAKVNAGEVDLDDGMEGMFENVLVEVYTSKSVEKEDEDDDEQEDQAKQVFVEINKAQPVKQIDMPGIASTADRRTITSAVHSLKQQYPLMFSLSQSCRVPNVNEDNLRNQIFGANILKKGYDTPEKLLEWLQVKNAALGAIYEGDKEKQGFVRERAWKKASDQGFYLGLENSWLYSE